MIIIFISDIGNECLQLAMLKLYSYECSKNWTNNRKYSYRKKNIINSFEPQFSTVT